MSDRLLDDVVHDQDKPRADSEFIRTRFVRLGRKYADQTDDPTAQDIKVLPLGK